MNFLYMAWVLMIGFYFIIALNEYIKNMAIRDIERKYRVHYFVIAGILIVIGMFRFDSFAFLGITISVELQYLVSYMFLFFSIWFNIYRYQFQER